LHLGGSERLSLGGGLRRLLPASGLLGGFSGGDGLLACRYRGLLLGLPGRRTRLLAVADPFPGILGRLRGARAVGLGFRSFLPCFLFGHAESSTRIMDPELL